jgi:excisionase family DNA binding protein
MNGVEPMLTTKELAQQLNVTSWTVRRWIALGQGPCHVRIGKGHIRFRAEDVRAWLDRESRTASIDHSHKG